MQAGTGVGLELFKDCDLTLLRENISDIDGDGLSNGEEMSIERLNGVTYLKLNSNPFNEDTYEDGILDGPDDTAPFTYGQKGGIIGELYLAVHPTKVDSKGINYGSFKTSDYSGSLNSSDSGHAWLVLHSYCNINFESKELKQGYIKCKLGDNYTKFVARHNLYPYKLASNSYMSIGYYPKDKAITEGWDDNIGDEEIGQILLKQYELEQAKLYEEANKLNDSITDDLRINQEFKNSTVYDYYEGARYIKQEITYKQLQKFVKSLDNLPDYFSLTYNCTNFAINSWNLTIANPLMYKEITYSPTIFAMPSILYVELVLSGGEKNFHEYMYSKQAEMVPDLEFDINGILIN